MPMPVSLRRCLVLFSAPLALIAGLPAAAQGDDAQAQGESSAIEEVMITARKREESLQTVPLAVTAYGTAALERAQVANLEDMNLATPNMQVNRTQGSQNTAQIFIRGIGQDNSTALDEPGVAFYVDGVYMARSIGSLVDLIDIERVEVLRGPQGTLYGRNATGGAVKFISKRPSTSDVDYNFDIATGSFHRLDLRGALNVPLSDTVALRVSGVSRNNDGYYTHAVTGVDLNRRDSQGMRASLLWEASDNFDVVLAVDRSRDRSGMQVGTVYTSFDPAVAEPVYGDPYLVAPSLEDRNRYDGWGASATMTWSIGDAQVQSITAYREFDYFHSYDLTSQPTGLKLERPFLNDQVTQELQYSSAAIGRFSFVAGAYFFRERSHEDLDLIVRTAASDLRLPYYARQESRSVAVYGEGTYDFTDRLSATIGLRYTDDEKDLARDGLFAGVAVRESSDNLSPRVLLSYKMNPDLMLFGSVSQGYKAGQFQAFPATAADAAAMTQPEEVTSYELGAKSTLWDGRATVNATLFQADYEDLALSLIGGGLLFADTADLRARGIEVEFNVRPVDPLLIYGFVGVNDSEFVRATPGPGGAVNPLLGDQQKFTPKSAYRLGADYDFTVGADRTLTAGAVYTHSSDYQQGTPNQPWLVQPSYGVIDARLVLRDSVKGWSVELAGQNLTDEEYFLSSSTLGAPVRYLDPGRTWSLRARFGF